MIRQAKRALKQKKKGGANTEKEEKKRKFISYSGPHEFPTEAQRDKVYSFGLEANVEALHRYRS